MLKRELFVTDKQELDELKLKAQSYFKLNINTVIFIFIFEFKVVSLI
jgi:hypothetical protein